MYLNCNHRALCQFMELLALKFDVIILSEIWSTNINFYHNLKGYTFFYELPKETHIGGIGVFISNDFSHLERNEFKIPTSDANRVENIWYEIAKNGFKKYVIGGIYL